MEKIKPDKEYKLKYIKFVNAEDVIAKVDIKQTESDGYLVINDPVQLLYGQSENGDMVTKFVPWAYGTHTTEVYIKKSSVITMLQPTGYLTTQYDKYITDHKKYEPFLNQNYKDQNDALTELAKAKYGNTGIVYH